MRKVNKAQYKMKVLQALRRAGKPIWVSDLQKKYGLEDVSLFRKGKPRPTQEALRELEAEGKIRFLLPRYYKPDSTKPRRKIMLAGKENPRKYFEVELMDKIHELETTINNLTNNNMTSKTKRESIAKKLLGFLADHPKGATRKQIAQHFNLTTGGIYRKSAVVVSMVLYKLLDNGMIIERKGRGKSAYFLAEHSQTKDTNAEQELMSAINNYLALKKNEMLDEISQEHEKAIKERDYFQNLCKEYKEEIDELEGKLNSRKFLGINW